MIKIDKEILQEIQSEYPHIKRHDINQHLLDIHPNGFQFTIILHLGLWNTTNFFQLMNIDFDDKGNRIKKHLDWGNTENDVWSFQDNGRLNSLQDEIELLKIRGMRFASDEQSHAIRLFAYKWRGLLDRMPTMLGAINLIPQESTTKDPNLHYELRSDAQAKIFKDILDKLKILEVQLDKDRFPPKNCPTFKIVKNWNGTIYELVHNYCKDMHSIDWADEQINVCKYIALKYTIKKEWKSPKDLMNAYKQSKQRTSKIVK